MGLDHEGKDQGRGAPFGEYRIPDSEIVRTLQGGERASAEEREKLYRTRCEEVFSRAALEVREASLFLMSTRVHAIL